MLCEPGRFARKLRHDESLMPAACTALVSFAIYLAAVGIPSSGDFKEFTDGFTLFTVTLTAVIVCQSLCFSTLHYDRIHRRARWGARFRMWLMVSLYSTCFVASWPIVDGQPCAFFSHASFFIPFFNQSGGPFIPSPALGTTIITYWWWLILAVMLVVRNRPRWLALASIPLVYLFMVLGTCVFAILINAINPESLRWLNLNN